MTEHRQSMRSWLAALERDGQLIHIAEPVDRDFELAACLAESDGRPLRFGAVRGSAMPVVGNLLSTLASMAAALGTSASELQALIAGAISRPLPPRIVADAPCQHVAIENPDLAAELPIPRFFEREGGPYISAGAIVARDSAGRANLSIARLRPLGGNRAFVGIAPNHHLAVFGRAAAARGETLEIAVAIGNHPAVLLAACLYLRLGEDELAVAGALLGEPVEAAQTAAGLLVPAQAECILEGTLDFTELVTEGPVSEFHGLYEDYGKGVVATFRRLTRRRDAIYQTILPGYHGEHCLLGGVAIAAGLLAAARANVPSIAAIAVGMAGAGRLRAVVSLAGKHPGDARKAMFAIWAAVNLIKQIVIVDDDIDPWNEAQVQWAIATRMKADRDLVVVPAVRADRSEPLEAEGTVAKLGIDATRRDGDRPSWDLAQPPAAALATARRLLATI